MSDREISILIADADDEARQQLAETLRELSRDLMIIEAEDGRKALSVLTSQPVDIVFLDVVLPYMDTARLVDWFDAPRDRPTKLILISDILSQHWPAIATRVGAYDVMLKPFIPANVLRLMKAFDAILSKLSILVVDPIDNSRRIVRRIVGDSQFSLAISEAESARSALRLSRAKSFDVVLIDFAVSDMPPLELACQIQQASSDRTRVIMMGGTVDKGLAKMLPTFGVSGFLPKPFFSVDLDRSLHGALGLWRPYLLNALLAARTGKAA